MDKNNMLLCHNFTIEDYLEFEKSKDMVNIARIIYERLYRRYINPFLFKSDYYIENHKNAFAMMACASLFIETFISFKRGYQETPYKKAEILFNSFFKDETNELSIFSSINFYKDIRCAILHQGETRKWKLWRKGKLLDFETKSINVNKFIIACNNLLEDYINKLGIADWNSIEAENARIKINHIINNASSN